MNILACDTSTEVMHLCLYRTEEGKAPFYEMLVARYGNRHSELLVPRVLDLCNRNAIAMKDLDLLVCTSGPGSFTGLRIAMSTFKGISLATGIPLVSIPTLEVYHQYIAASEQAVLLVMDAKKKRFYSALYENGMRCMEDIDADVEQIEHLMAPFSRILISGPDAALLAEKLSDATSPKVVIDTTLKANLSVVLAEMGKERFEEAGADDIQKGPCYIRKSDAEIALLHTIQSLEVKT